MAPRTRQQVQVERTRVDPEKQTNSSPASRSSSPIAYKIGDIVDVKYPKIRSKPYRGEVIDKRTDAKGEMIDVLFSDNTVATLRSNDMPLVKMVEPASKRNLAPAKQPPPPKPPKATRQSKDAFLKQEQEQQGKNAITSEQFDLLNRLYFDDRILFGLGRDRIHHFLINHKDYKKYKIQQRQVNRYLKSLEISQIFQPKKPITDVAKTLSTAPFKRVEADLLDLSNKATGDWKWLLVMIDTFSKYAVAIPMKNKEGPTVLAAMKKAFKKVTQTGFKVRSMLTDYGSEFVNASMEDYLKRQDTTHIYTKPQSTTSHAKNVENYNGYIRKRITMYQTQFDRNDWNRYINDIVRNYNQTKHRITNESPVDVLKMSKEETEAVRQTIRKNVLPKNAKPYTAYKVGDLVRLQVQMDSAFEKPTNNISFTRNVYEITKVNQPKSDSVLQPTYTIKSLPSNEVVKEKFFHNDMRKVEQTTKQVQAPEKYIIQKMLKLDKFPVGKTGQMRDYILVKWKGYPSPTYVPVSTLRLDVPKDVAAFLKRVGK